MEIRWIGCLAIAIGAFWLGAGQAQESSSTPPSVVVTEVTSRDVTPHFDYVGRVEAVDKVDLRARVEGFLEERNFLEGRTVNKGDLLFVIEKAPYEVIVEQRSADLAGAQASLKNAQATLKRQRALVKRNVVSQSDLDLASAEEATARAAVLTSKAALKSAELDLSYTEVRSPIGGSTSRARYSVGNLVGPTSEPLATVTSLDPVYVTIGVTERDLLEARRRGLRLDDPRVRPSLILSDGSPYEHGGVFNYLDPEVTATTDTILARAEFANPERILVPGQFVTVTVRQKKRITSLVVPQASVQEDQQGFFVLVVDKANKVEVRRVETGVQVETDWVIESGLAEGERIIVEGVQKVRPDMVVNAVEAKG